MLNNDTNHSIGNQLRSQKKKRRLRPERKGRSSGFCDQKAFLSNSIFSFFVYFTTLSWHGPDMILLIAFIRKKLNQLGVVQKYKNLFLQNVQIYWILVVLKRVKIMQYIGFFLKVIRSCVSLQVFKKTSSRQFITQSLRDRRQEFYHILVPSTRFVLYDYPASG